MFFSILTVTSAFDILEMTDPSDLKSSATNHGVISFQDWNK
jgi:hypothetical protein